MEGNGSHFLLSCWSSTQASFVLTVWRRALPVSNFSNSGILCGEFCPEFCSPASRRYPPKDLNLPVPVTDPQLRSGCLTTSSSRSWTPVEEALSRRGLCVFLFRLEEGLRRVLLERVGFPAVTPTTGSRCGGGRVPGCWGAGPKLGRARPEQQRFRRSLVRSEDGSCGHGDGK